MESTLSPSQRCAWVDLTDPRSVTYHDQEWGMPQWDDTALFGALLLETAQAGLSWATILRKRKGYAACFADFDPSVVATFGEERVQALLQDTRIVRHVGKIRTAVRNARAFVALQAREGSFARYLWAFVDDEPIVRRPAMEVRLPTATPLAEAITEDLKQHGFAGIGPTTIYAYLQAIGVVNDHVVGCFRCPPR